MAGHGRRGQCFFSDWSIVGEILTAIPKCGVRLPVFVWASNQRDTNTEILGLILMGSNESSENYGAIELAIKRLVDEITKLSDDSNRALESAVFVGMSREQQIRREQRLKEMHSLLERLQSKQEELERVKRQSRAAGS